MLLLFTVKTPISQHDEPFSLKKKKQNQKLNITLDHICISFSEYSLIIPVAHSKFKRNL